MIALSLKSRRAYGVLYRAYNDIDIYVEDSIYLGVYERIVNRILGGKAKISKVIPLGPRNIVVAAAQQDVVVGVRRRLYIVDGDLDLLAFARMPSAPHLHRLRVYSLENLVCDPQALSALCIFALTKFDSAAAINAVDLRNTYDGSAGKLAAYLCALAIARRHNLRKGVYAFQPSTVSKMVGGRPVGIDRSKVNTRLRDIIKNLHLNIGKSNYLKSKRLVQNNYRRRRILPIDFVPAKELLLNFVLQKYRPRAGSL